MIKRLEPSRGREDLHYSHRDEAEIKQSAHYVFNCLSILLSLTPFRERSLSLWSGETLANDLMVCPGGVRRWKRNWGGLKTNLIRPPSSEWKWKNRIRFGGVGMMVGWLDDAI